MSLKSKIKNENVYGEIEIIYGSMFSGKTEAIIKKIIRAKEEKLKVKVFKPKLDNRFFGEKIISHDKTEIPAISVNNTNEIVRLSKDADVIAIDEVQFFNKDIVKTCVLLSTQGSRIILAGLDMDFLGRPFGSMPELMAIADDIIKLHAICEVCSGPADHTFRISKNKKTIDIGEKNKYQALCRICFNKKISENE
jgi:thymidine kinase|tara:strand:- start:2906 stop:3490 length:585 start_codon:yes stop_codon:yes gene_type:complete